MKKLLSAFLAIGLFLTGLVSIVKADGMIMPPDYYTVYETGQKAFIIYEDNHEELIVSISFNGKASDFGWVMPLPNQPEISKVDSSIFRKLSELTEPKQNLLDKIRGEEYYYPMYGALETAAPGGEKMEDRTTVEVIEEDSIGIFDYAILKAGEPEDLKEWMEDNDYNLPTTETDDDWLYEYPGSPINNQSQAEAWSDALPIFQDYIDSDWYFVTVKVSNKFEDSSGVTTQLEEGAVDPLRFSFETTDMIYPMKLTGLSKQSISVVLYIIDDHKVKVENYNRDYCSSDDEDCSYFDIQYAGKIKKDQIEELTKEVGKGSWYSPEKDKYITKLYDSNLSYEVMEEEVLFEDTKNNQGVNDGSMSLGEWLLLPFVLIVYLPYLVLGGFFSLISDGGYGYYYGLEAVWFIGICAVLFFGGVAWTVLSVIFLKKTKSRLKRMLLYITQFPAVWFVGLVISLAVVIPLAMAIGVLSTNEGVVFLDSFCCFSLVTTLLPIIFYRLLWKRRTKKIKK